MSGRKRAVILANGRMEGWPPGLEVEPDKDLIVCADGGLAHARRFGLTPHLIIGDMDSADREDLERLAGQGVEVVRHPVDKDETDLELALLAALERRAVEIVVLGALGRRLDMTLANVLLLASNRVLSGLPPERRPSLVLLNETETAFFVKGPAEIRLDGRAGQTLSLLPLESPVRGVTLKGLKYPLKGAALTLGSTRGISNLIEKSEAELRLREGGLLVVISTRAD